MFTFPLHHVDGMKVGLQLNKSICDTNLSFIFEGTTGTKGIKGTFLALYFSPGRAWRSRVGSCAWERTGALSQRITRNAFFIKCFIYESHTLQFLIPIFFF